MELVEDSMRTHLIYLSIITLIMIGFFCHWRHHQATELRLEQLQAQQESNG